jgi:hypothetical protein
MIAELKNRVENKNYERKTNILNGRKADFSLELYYDGISFIRTNSNDSN